jgi:hypothetical protein
MTRVFGSWSGAEALNLAAQMGNLGARHEPPRTCLDRRLQNLDAFNIESFAELIV